MRIAVCIVTYQRPRWLEAALRSVADLRVPPGGAELAIFVIDNDRHGSARELVSSVRPGFPWPLEYEVESRQGISFGRNRAVQRALAWRADFVAFLDDDEVAAPGWLEELLTVRQRYGAEVVSGPVVPRYEPGVPEWSIRGRFFERSRHPTGTCLESVGAGNCLISAALVAGSATPFDPAFALTGGEDTHFFRCASRAGARIVWADDAVVFERVPVSRATVAWLLRRGFRGGSSFARSERLLNRGLRWIPIRLCTSLARSVQGIALLVPALFLGKARIVRALLTVCIAAGLLAGTFGFSYREYTVVHGE